MYPFRTQSASITCKRWMYSRHLRTDKPWQKERLHISTRLCSVRNYFTSHISAKETEVKLPGEEWWEVFDVDREELGFLVVALISMEGFIAGEVKKWVKSKIPLTLEDTQAWIDREARV
jgi:hypothetical protein